MSALSEWVAGSFSSRQGPQQDPQHDRVLAADFRRGKLLHSYLYICKYLYICTDYIHIQITVLCKVWSMYIREFMMHA